MAVFALKGTTRCYFESVSPIFTKFLDASEKFVTVNFAKLFSKFLQRGVPQCLIVWLDGVMRSRLVSTFRTVQNRLVSSHQNFITSERSEV